MSAERAKTRGLALAWVAVLAAGMIAWVGAPDIPVTEQSGNGCGRWNSAELSRHQEQLAAFVLLPLLVAEGIAAAWLFFMRRANLRKFALLATGGLACVLLWLWQPASIVFVYSQLLRVIVTPALVLAIYIWSLEAVSNRRERSEPLPRGTVPLLALAPPFAFITLVLWTRTPWIFTC